MDMNDMVLAYGAPELSLMMAGITELAHFAGLPLWQTGGCTDSKCLDEQAAIEGSLSSYFSALSAGDLCHDVGYTESAMTGSLEQLVMRAFRTRHVTVPAKHLRTGEHIANVLLHTLGADAEVPDSLARAGGFFRAGGHDRGGPAIRGAADLSGPL